MTKLERTFIEAAAARLFRHREGGVFEDALNDTPDKKVVNRHGPDQGTSPLILSEDRRCILCGGRMRADDSTACEDCLNHDFVGGKRGGRLRPVGVGFNDHGAVFTLRTADRIG